MNKFGWVLWALVGGTGLARGLTTDDYYSVQNGYWDQASTWTSPAPMALSYPQAGDTAYVYHELMATTSANCAHAYVTGRVQIGSSGQLDVYKDATLNGAHLAGPGPFKTWNVCTLTGQPSYVAAQWFNLGEVQVQTPSLQLENNFYNDGGTVVVHAGTFTLTGTTGLGRVIYSNGTWQLHAGATCNVAQFESLGKLSFVGSTGSAFHTLGHCQLAGGTWHLEEGARFIAASTACTAHLDGEYATTGNGQWHLEGGTAFVSHASATTTAFNGGTYYWREGEIDVHPSGQLENHGEFHWAGSAATQRLAGLFVNRGNVWLGAVTGIPGHCRLDGIWSNAPGSTTTLAHSDFRWRGTGTFENAGTFRVADGVTGSTESVRFRQLGGTLVFGTGSTFSIHGYRQQHTGGSFRFATGAVCQVGCGGTDYWDGVYTTTGEGCLRMDGGTLMASHYSSTTTVFNAGGGGFQWRGGLWNVRAPHALENRGRLHVAPTSGPVTLQGNFRNQGQVFYGLTSGPCLLSAAGSEIVNGQTGVWNFVEEGGAIDPLSYGFNNYGTVNYQAATVSLAGWYFNQSGGTTVIRRGTARFPNGCAVQGGTLRFDGGTADGNVYQVGMAASRLCGTGSIAGYVYQDYGTVAPGHSPGALAIGGRYEQTAGAALEIELGGKMSGTGYDQLRVGGNAILKGTLNVELYDGFSPAAGQRFDIVVSAAVSNAFAATNLPALPPGVDWLLIYRTNGVQLRVATATDADGDGLQDDWEITHFGDTASRDGGDEDFDDDGYADYVEQCLGTQPTNNADFFRSGEIAVSGNNSLLGLRTGDMAWYSIEARSDLSDPVGEWTVVDEFFGTGGEIVRTNAADGTLRFYRLRATMP